MLNRQEIIKLIKEKDLVTGFFDLDTQLTPNGFDLTAASVFQFQGPGALDFSNQERILPPMKELIPQKNDAADKFGWWALEKGAYKIRTNEIVNFPKNLVGIAFPRSSLLRMGAFIQNGFWDAGFKGRSEFILVVENPQGLKLKQNARINQLSFIRINEADAGYQGVYQNSA